MLGAPTWRRRWRGLESQSCPRGLLARNQRVVLLDFSKTSLILLLDNPESARLISVRSDYNKNTPGADQKLK